MAAILGVTILPKSTCKDYFNSYEIGFVPQKTVKSDSYFLPAGQLKSSDQDQSDIGSKRRERMGSPAKTGGKTDSRSPGNMPRSLSERSK